MLRVLISFCIALIVFLAGTAYTLTQTKIYEASGMLQIWSGEQNEKPNEIRDSFESPIERAQSILGSSRLTKEVALKLSDEEREHFSKYYPQDTEITSILQAHRSFQRMRHSMMLKVNYRHPDPKIAAKVANLYMREFIDYMLMTEIDTRMKEVEDLRIRADRQSTRIEELRAELQELKLQEATEPSPELSEKLKALESDFKVQEDLRTAIQEKFKEHRVMIGLREPLARIVDEASRHKTHISPNIPVQIAGSAAAGMLTGIFTLLFFGIVKKRDH